MDFDSIDLSPEDKDIYDEAVAKGDIKKLQELWERYLMTKGQINWKSQFDSFGNEEDGFECNHHIWATPIYIEREQKNAKVIYLFKAMPGHHVSAEQLHEVMVEDELTKFMIAVYSHVPYICESNSEARVILDSVGGNNHHGILIVQGVPDEEYDISLDTMVEIRHDTQSFIAGNSAVSIPHVVHIGFYTSEGMLHWAIELIIASLGQWAFDKHDAIIFQNVYTSYIEDNLAVIKNRCDVDIRQLFRFAPAFYVKPTQGGFRVRVESRIAMVDAYPVEEITPNSFLFRTNPIVTREPQYTFQELVSHIPNLMSIIYSGRNTVYIPTQYYLADSSYTRNGAMCTRVDVDYKFIGITDCDILDVAKCLKIIFIDVCDWLDLFWFRSNELFQSAYDKNVYHYGVARVLRKNFTRNDLNYTRYAVLKYLKSLKLFPKGTTYINVVGITVDEYFFLISGPKSNYFANCLRLQKLKSKLKKDNGMVELLKNYSNDASKERSDADVQDTCDS